MRSMWVYGAVLLMVAAVWAEEEPAMGPAPATQVVRIAGVPAEEWLGAVEPVGGEYLQGRLWVLGVLEPWSVPSRKAAGMLARTAYKWSPRGVEAYLVTASSADQTRKDLGEEAVGLPIGTGSALPMLLGLQPLPHVYLVGPEQTVVWSGMVWHLADALPEYYGSLTAMGLTTARANELENRLNRAKAALEHEEYFLAVGLTQLVTWSAPAGHPLKGQAKELLDRIERIGAEQVRRAETMVRGKQPAEGYDLLQKVAEGFHGTGPGTQALAAMERLRADDGKWAAVTRRRDEASADRTLALAREAVEREMYAAAERYYKLIAELYPRTAAAREAKRGLAGLRAPGPASQLARQRAEPTGPVLLSLAARYAQMGRHEEARRYYEQVIREAGETVYAEEARRALAGLGSN